MSEGKNTVMVTFRLNLEIEQHYRIFDMLESTDLKVYKSKSQFIINVLDEYCGRLQQSGKQAGEIRSGGSVAGDEFRQEIRDIARDEVLHMLGSVLAGREGASGVYRKEPPGAGSFKEEHITDETEDDLSEDVKNLIGMWSQ